MATRDVAAYQPGQPYVAALVTPNTPGRAITGVEKLAQRFTLELTTEAGSIPFADRRGCSFLQALRSGALLTETDAIVAFYTALLTVTDNLQTEESDDDPDNERYSNAELRNLTVEPGKVTLNVALYSRTNQLANLTIPISMVVTPSHISGLD